MKHKHFEPECKMRVSASNSSFGSKAKMSRFSPNIFWTFYQFSSSLSITIEYSKIAFFCFSKICPFWLWTWSKIKNFHFHCKTWIICFYQKNIFDHIQSWNGSYLAKTEKFYNNFSFRYSIVSDKLPEFW